MVCEVQIEEAVGAPKDGVLVNGDSGNDIELFQVPGVRGCMVVNAHPELKQWCDAHASPNLFQVGCRDWQWAIQHETSTQSFSNFVTLGHLHVLQWCAWYGGD